MPRDLQQLLEDTASRPTAPLDARGIVRRARRQQLTARAGVSAASALAVLLVALAVVDVVDTRPEGDVLLESGRQPSGEAAEAWSDATAFTGPTDTVLLFDTGTDGVLALDLDTGAAARQSLEGQWAGDQPYRLWRTDDSLLVGVGRIYAVPISTGRSELLGEATVFVPAAEPGQAWLVDHASGRLERGTPVTYRLVTTDGEVQVEAPGVEDAFPAHGITGGLALESESGVAIWDAEARGVVRRLGEGSAFVADAHDRTVAWCEDPCTQLVVTDLDGEEQTFGLRPEHGEAFDARSARFSPDGRHVAAIAGDAEHGGPESAGTVLLLDVATGQMSAITPPLAPPPAYLGWAPDGSQLFLSSYAYGAPQTNVGRYRMAAGGEPRDAGDPEAQLELVTLPFGGTLSFVTLQRDEADAFLDGAERPPDQGDAEGAGVAVPSYDRVVELAVDATPMAGTVVLTEPPAEEMPDNYAVDVGCCLVRHPNGPALVDDEQKVLRVYPGIHSVGYGRAGLDVVSAAVLDSGAVALLGHRLTGRPSLIVLPLAELPDLTQASGPFFEPVAERIDVPDDAEAVAAGRGGFWVRTGDGWVRVTDEEGSGIAAVAVAERLVLRDGSAIAVEDGADGTAVLHQETEAFALRLELTVPDRHVSLQRVEAVDGPAPHSLLVVLRIDGGEEPEHRLLGISGDAHVDYGTLTPGDTWPERLALTADGQLYHLHSDDAGATVTRYVPDLTRLRGAEDTAADAR